MDWRTVGASHVCLGLIVIAGSSLVSDLATRLMLEPGVVITNSLLMASAGIASNLEKSHRSLVWHGLKRDRKSVV